jgi:hypothetical protein
MNVQEQEEQDFNRMSPYEFEERAVQQEGHLNPSLKWLLTDYDTFVPNPFWNGTVTPDPWAEDEGDDLLPREVLTELTAYLGEWED